MHVNNLIENFLRIFALIEQFHSEVHTIWLSDIRLGLKQRKGKDNQEDADDHFPRRLVDKLLANGRFLALALGREVHGHLVLHHFATLNVHMDALGEVLSDLLILDRLRNEIARLFAFILLVGDTV